MAIAIFGNGGAPGFTTAAVTSLITSVISAVITTFVTKTPDQTGWPATNAARIPDRLDSRNRTSDHEKPWPRMARAPCFFC
jgi:hypothetical protein